MAMTEDERKFLYDKLMDEKKGTNYNTLGGVASGISRMAQADAISRGGKFIDSGEPLRQAGQEQKEAAQRERDKWMERLKMDTQAKTRAEDVDYRERKLASDTESKDKDRVLREKLGMNKGTTAQTKAFDFMNTPQGLVRVNRVTGEQELMQRAAPKPSKPPTAIQAKKAGQVEVGQAAEEQYRKAMESGEYDPTSYLDPANYEITPQFLKGDEAKVAQSARDSWVETYLRDASGAAIPKDERKQYYEIYFPRKGDTSDVVANKQRLRQEKEDALRTEAGVPTQPQQSEIKEVKRKTKDGRTAIFNADTREFIRYE